MDNIGTQRTSRVATSHLPISERRMLLVLGDIAMGVAATGIAIWLNALFG